MRIIVPKRKVAANHEPTGLARRHLNAQRPPWRCHVCVRMWHRAIVPHANNDFIHSLIASIYYRRGSAVDPQPGSSDTRESETVVRQSRYRSVDQSSSPRYRPLVQSMNRAMPSCAMIQSKKGPPLHSYMMQRVLGNFFGRVPLNKTLRKESH